VITFLVTVALVLVALRFVAYLAIFTIRLVARIGRRL
jgi:hypothetical protein